MIERLETGQVGVQWMKTNIWKRVGSSHRAVEESETKGHSSIIEHDRYVWISVRRLLICRDWARGAS